ncbi:Vacuolar membrane-associated protein iml1 [Frankliniella fusca]|uniref:Vacuolar membrane-associated protein iml1 n=1 Tax=Frankliniella fusca TaxID=407009 RepID=A0AAE1LCJ1_9NEOP|nr:Vacuolar membrane-associated protein iml1 [Frankliniella fusca]
MFRFPNVIRKVNGVMQVDQTKLNRFLVWLKNVGNENLLLYDPKSINEKYFLCKDHFEDKYFNHQKRENLISTAVPSCGEHSLCEQNMEEYHIIIRWSEHNYDAMCFDKSKRAAIDFEDEMKNLKWNECASCKEKFLVKGSYETKCLHRGKCWEYCDINNMDPGSVPVELEDLTFIEERLIARVHPLISVYMLTRNGQYGYRKNVINFSQDIESFVKELPVKVTDLNSVIIVRKEGEDNTYHDFNVRAGNVRAALVWLKQNNKFYEDISINEDNLNLLPEDSNVPNEIPSCSNTCVTVNNVISMNTDDASLEEGNVDDAYCTVVSDVVFPHQDEQIKNYLKWPSLESQPIDEYSTPGYIACAFPTLFCYGKGDLRDWHEKDLNVSHYFKHLLRYRDERFSKHKTFRFFAYNSWMRWTALTDGNIFVKQNEEFRDMKVDQLKEILNDNPNILKKIMFNARNLRGSKAYWHSRSGELRDMVNQLNMPTIFLTLSAADLHWKDLYRLLTGQDDLSHLSEYERHKLLRDNPQIVDEFFDMRVNAFLKHVLIKNYNVIDYWYRIEYQHRGSPHLHGVFWLENAVNCDNIEKATPEELEVIVDYFKNLISAINPDSHTEINDDHPCRKVYGNVIDFQKDLAELLNTVQRHTRCSTEYCLRYNKRTKESKCRFGFPILELNEEAKCQANECGEIEFCPARNDDRLNKYNQFIIQLWRANMDIAPVISKKRLMAYLAKYISKSEVSAISLHDLMNGIMDRMNDENKSVRAIQRFFIKACVERDVSAQEVSHILLGLKLYSSGKRSFVIINFNNKRWCQVLSDTENENDSVNGKSFIEKYKDRPAFMENVSLWDAAKKYNSVKWKLLSHNTENIVRVFPIVKLKVDEDNEEYYEQQVYSHVPWRNEENVRAENETWNNVYNTHGLSNVPGVGDLLENVVCDNREDDDDDSEHNEDELNSNFYEGELERESNEEWMICSSIGRGRIDKVELGKRQEDLNYPP